MKTAAWTIAAVVLAACVSVWADEPSATTMPAGYVIHIEGLGLTTGTYEELVKAAELTDEQQKKCVKIEQQRAEQAKEKEKALRAARAALAAHPGPDASNEVNRAGMAVWETQTKALAEVQNLLTPPQKAKWREYMILKAFKSAFSVITLDDKQWDKVIAACEKLVADSSLSNYLVLRKLLAKAEDILTPEQQTTRFKAKHAAMIEACGLTDEQIQKIVKVEQERVKVVGKAEDELESAKAKLMKDSRAAHESGDLVAFETAQTQMGQLYKPVRELEQKYDDKVLSVLNDKQRAAWRERAKHPK